MTKQEQSLLSPENSEEYARALAELREDKRQAHRDASGYLTHRMIEDACNDAGALSLAKGEYLAGFEQAPDGRRYPLIKSSDNRTFVAYPSTR